MVTSGNPGRYLPKEGKFRFHLKQNSGPNHLLLSIDY